MLCIFKVEISLPGNVTEFFYHRLDSDDDHNLNKFKDKLFKLYEILNNASFKMIWIDNAGDRINILEEDDLRIFVEMKGSKVIVLADPSDKETIINELSGQPQDVNENNIRCDQSVKMYDLKCSGCNVDLCGIRFKRTDRINFYLCFLCGMSKKQYNLEATIYTVQPLNDSHTMITSSSQTKEISEWMENSRKRVIYLMNELSVLEETLISILRSGTTAVETVATRKEILQDNLRGSKSIKGDQQVSKTLLKMPCLNYLELANLVSPVKLIAPKDEAKEGSVIPTIPSSKNSNDNSLDWQEPNNFPSKHSKETVSYSSDDSSSDEEEASDIPSKSSRENPKDFSDDSSSEEEDVKKVHEHPKDSSDNSSLDEGNVQKGHVKPSIAAPANSSRNSSWDCLGLNLVPLGRFRETANDSSDDSSVIGPSSEEVPLKPSNSSDDSSSDEQEANNIPLKSSRENPLDDSSSEEENVKKVHEHPKDSSHNSSLDEDEVQKGPLKPSIAATANSSGDSSWDWLGLTLVPLGRSIETANDSSDDGSDIGPLSDDDEVKKVLLEPSNSSDDSSSDEQEANNIQSKSSRENPKVCSDDSSSEEEDVLCSGNSSKSINQIYAALKRVSSNNATKSSDNISSTDEYEVKLPFFTTTIANLVSPAKLIEPKDEAKKSSVKPPRDSSLDWQRSNNFPSKSSGETVNDSSDDSSLDEDEVQKGPVKHSLATSTTSSDDSSSDDEEANIIPSKSSRATPMVLCDGSSSSDDSSSDEDDGFHLQASPATSIHTSDNKPSDKEEARKDSPAIPISSVQPTLIENMNLPKDLLQWIQWINRTQQN